MYGMPVLGLSMDKIVGKWRFLLIFEEEEGVDEKVVEKGKAAVRCCLLVKYCLGNLLIRGLSKQL